MKYTIKDFHKQFPDDDVCLKHVFDQKYGKDYKCPKCSKGIFYRVKARKCFSCSCGYQVYPLKNTIFYRSSTPLTDWFYAIYLFSVSKHGVSASELQRHLGVTYKCAWRMANRIRTLTKDPIGGLTGIVEADETYIGGKKRGSTPGRGTSKQAVMGIVQRGGPVRAFVLPGVDRYNLMKRIKQEVEEKSWLMTDEWPGYDTAGETYVHSVIKHKEKIYVRGLISTNTVEGFWAIVKRGIRGTHVHVSKKHLQSYLDFYAFQYSHRTDTTPLFHTLLDRVTDRSLY